MSARRGQCRPGFVKLVIGPPEPPASSDKGSDSAPGNLFFTICVARGSRVRRLPQPNDGAVKRRADIDRISICNNTYCNAVTVMLALSVPVGRPTSAKSGNEKVVPRLWSRMGGPEPNGSPPKKKEAGGRSARFSGARACAIFQGWLAVNLQRIETLSAALVSETSASVIGQRAGMFSNTQRRRRDVGWDVG
jgi:hypothetical protein